MEIYSLILWVACVIGLLVQMSVHVLFGALRAAIVFYIGLLVGSSIMPIIFLLSQGYTDWNGVDDWSIIDMVGVRDLLLMSYPFLVIWGVLSIFTFAAGLVLRPVLLHLGVVKRGSGKGRG